MSETMNNEALTIATQAFQLAFLCNGAEDQVLATAQGGAFGGAAKCAHYALARAFGLDCARHVEERVWNCCGVDRQEVEFYVKEWQDMDAEEREERMQQLGIVRTSSLQRQPGALY
jgi:hypothetical protein